MKLSMSQIAASPEHRARYRFLIVEKHRIMSSRISSMPPAWADARSWRLHLLFRHAWEQCNASKWAKHSDILLAILHKKHWGNTRNDSRRLPLPAWLGVRRGILRYRLYEVIAHHWITASAEGKIISIRLISNMTSTASSYDHVASRFSESGRRGRWRCVGMVLDASNIQLIAATICWRS